MTEQPNVYIAYGLMENASVSPLNLHYQRRVHVPERVVSRRAVSL